MYNSETEVLFPERAIIGLRGLRGPEWDVLIEQVHSSEIELDKTAFVLMMVRILGCIACNADSFRAMRGCIKCAQQSIRRYRGDDQDLLKLFEKSKLDIEEYKIELENKLKG